MHEWIWAVVAGALIFGAGFSFGVAKAKHVIAEGIKVRDNAKLDATQTLAWIKAHLGL